ncbi:chemotaxis protein CheB [Nostoc favosum]|uniref:protein-glutamate methylesterase n=1 Tax=Nostoc favosum CHAB5714 TaxID=2780399 RepID=A0ABS8IDU1_9NOSO|nr:chemotaxis protein CheB [Nostoc favosum]MCC5601627.1 chemotaxis protein CheB [Nostoc favosum CHAB5714]
MTQMAENAKNHLPHFNNAAFDVVAIAASAGGLTALIKLLSIPSEFTAAIAIVLTGTGSDGAMGVEAIKKMGGIIIVQDVKTAEFSGMPSAAIPTGNVDFILPLDEISSALVTLVMGECY